MKLTQKQLRKMILEEVEDMLDHETPEEVEPVEDAWAGGEDLTLPIDHSEAGGGPEEEEGPGDYFTEEKNKQAGVQESIRARREETKGKYVDENLKKQFSARREARKRKDAAGG